MRSRSLRTESSCVVKHGYGIPIFYSYNIYIIRIILWALYQFDDMGIIGINIVLSKGSPETWPDSVCMGGVDEQICIKCICVYDFESKHTCLRDFNLIFEMKTGFGPRRTRAAGRVR